jgi:hypothetical protein
MIKALVFGFAVGGGVQVWRNFPPEPHGTQLAVYVFSLAAILGAYVAGRARRGAGAVAVASATASASSIAAPVQTVQVLVGQSHGVHVDESPGRGLLVPDESAPWIEGGRAAITADQLEGMAAEDLADLLGEREAEV